MEEAENAVNEVMKEVNDRLGRNTYTALTMRTWYRWCAKSSWTEDSPLSCAESCTGGLFAKSLTDIPGISKML